MAWIDPALPIAALTPAQIVICTVFGEARSEPPEGQIGVAHVVQNRYAEKRFGDDIVAVCLKPWQFSCWNPAGGDGNYRRLADLVHRMASGAPITDPVTRQTAYLVHGVLDGYIPDTVKGATHYHTLKMQPRPKWAQPLAPVCQKGAHLFYVGVK